MQRRRGRNRISQVIECGRRKTRLYACGSISTRSAQHSSRKFLMASTHEVVGRALVAGAELLLGSEVEVALELLIVEVEELMALLLLMLLLGAELELPLPVEAPPAPAEPEEELQLVEEPAWMVTCWA